MVTIDKITGTAIAALSPILFSYIFKHFDDRNKTNIRKNTLDEADKRIDLLNKYFSVQNSFLNQEEMENLKEHVATELREIKKKIDETYKDLPQTKYDKLNGVEKVFLTFKPHSVMGWIWQGAFIINAIFFTFLVLGLFVDAAGNFSKYAFADNMKNSDLVLGTVFVTGLMFLLRWLALRNYKLSTT